MAAKLSDFDKDNVGEIVTGGMGDWFSAHLLRLIRHADLDNREKLRQVYPEHVAAYEKWLSGDV